MIFCNEEYLLDKFEEAFVTILILIDDFLQFLIKDLQLIQKKSHNPYFNRWFSAIVKMGFKIAQKWCHNPYFNRWFSAMTI